MNDISSLAVVKENVTLGKNIVIEEFCLIGIPDKSSQGKVVVANGAVIRAGTYIYSGVSIGENFQSGNKVNIRHNSTIGNNVSIGTNTVLEHSVEIGNGTRLHSSCFVPEFTSIGEDCWIGPNVTFTNAKYPNRQDTKKKLAPVIIEPDVVIGAGVTLLPGCVIGRGAFVGAGSLVTSNVKPNHLIYGTPAVSHGYLERR